MLCEIEQKVWCVLGLPLEKGGLGDRDNERRQECNGRPRLDALDGGTWWTQWRMREETCEFFFVPRILGVQQLQ